jgi:hypothetical protein
MALTNLNAQIRDLKEKLEDERIWKADLRNLTDSQVDKISQLERGSRALRSELDEAYDEQRLLKTEIEGQERENFHLGNQL